MNAAPNQFHPSRRKRRRVFGSLLVACWTVTVVLLYNERSRLDSTLTTQRQTWDVVHNNNQTATTTLPASSTIVRLLTNDNHDNITSKDPVDHSNHVSQQPEISLATHKPQQARDEQESHDSSRNNITRLRNINIIMMGDSLMRYQYLSLVYFLRWGRWFDPNITNVDNLMVEGTWEGTRILPEAPNDATQLKHHHNSNNHNNIIGSWNTFLYHSNRLLYPNEVCDCYRERKAVNAQVKMMENRYYYDPIYNNTVVYIQAMGHHINIHGRVRHPDTIVGPNRNVTLWDELQTQLVGTWSPYEWEFTEWHDVIRHYLAPLYADYIVLNSGWWRSKFGSDIGDNNNTASILLKQALQNVYNLSHNHTRSIWRTTTYPPWPLKRKWGSNASLVDEHMCQPTATTTFSLGCLNVSWTRHVARKYSKDGVHFVEPVYRVMNEAMLEQMGYSIILADDHGKATLGAEHERFNELILPRM